MEPINNEVEEIEEEKVQEEVEPIPDNRALVLPTGEWYMPDLKCTTLTQVFKDGRDYVVRGSFLVYQYRSRWVLRPLNDNITRSLQLM